MDLCKYKDVFGESRKGIHSIRIFDFAILDFVGLFILAYVLRATLDFPLMETIIALFIIGQILHYLFCVRTKFLEVIGL